MGAFCILILYYILRYTRVLKLDKVFFSLICLGCTYLSYVTLKDIKMSLGDDLAELMTVKEVATFLRVSPLTIKRWGKRGKLPAIRINARGDRRYKKEAVLWLLGEMKKETV